MRKQVRRLTAGMAVLVAGAALPLVATAPAQASNATASQCINYLRQQGFLTGPKVHEACYAAAGMRSGGYEKCSNTLVALGVHHHHTQKACALGVYGK